MSGNTACVIGASISGMLIGKLLAHKYNKVYIVEKRDEGFEKDVAHASHVHILLHKGLSELELLLPGITDDLIDAGGIKSNSTKNWISYFPFGSFPDYVSKLDIVCLSRSLLENIIRQRILGEESNIAIVNSATVTQYELSSVNNPKISYVTDTRHTLEVDLLVDASGQHSRADKYLLDSGFGQVEVETIDPKLGYASRRYNNIPFETDKHGMLVMPKDPTTPRGGVIFPV